VFGLHDGFVAKLKMFKEHFGVFFEHSCEVERLLCYRILLVEQASIYHFIKHKFPQA